jgi:hypothetical protein
VAGVCCYVLLYIVFRIHLGSWYLYDVIAQANKSLADYRALPTM